MESFPDTKGFNVFASNSSKNENQIGEKNGTSEIKFNRDDEFYNMSGEKLLVIFSHDKYDEESNYFYKCPPAPRKLGVKEDVEKLQSTFTELGFTVILHNNKEYDNLFGILGELYRRDMSTVSCLCVAILTHGFKGQWLCAYDRPYCLKDVLKLFESHPTMVGKPKMFFVQACRGNKADDGNRIAIDGEAKTEAVVPSHADFLVIRSTVDDYISYRNNEGSWMIQELCKALQKYRHLDILHIITHVQKSVALGYRSWSRNKAIHNKVQMPETTFTLTKFLKF